MPKTGKPIQSKKQKEVAKKEQQLNAWITTVQYDSLDQLYFRLRASGMKLKKGELVGVAIEILNAILSQYNPKAIDATLLDNFLIHYDKNKQK